MLKYVRIEIAVTFWRGSTPTICITRPSLQRVAKVRSQRHRKQPFNGRRINYGTFRSRKRGVKFKNPSTVFNLSPSILYFSMLIERFARRFLPTVGRQVLTENGDAYSVEFTTCKSVYVE